MRAVRVTSHFYSILSWEVEYMNRVKEALADKEVGRQKEKQRHGKEPIININEFNYLV